MSHHDELPSIDLTTVTGGTVGSSSSGSGSSDQLTTALQGITSSLAYLKKDTGGSSFEKMLPMLLMLRGGGGGGACPCGCGMSRCGR